jgi:hypothetical protein
MQQAASSGEYVPATYFPLVVGVQNETMTERDEVDTSTLTPNAENEKPV